MELANLASQLGQINNRNSSNALLPQQQKSRSYGDEPNTQYADLVINLTRRRFGEQRKKWILQYNVDFPIGSTAQKRVLPKQIETYAKDYLEANTDRGDEKYIEISRADAYMIEYTFDHEKWFRDNFSRRPYFKPPISLYWKYYKAFPRIIYVNNYGKDLKKFIEARFEDWIDKKKSYLKHAKFRFIEKIAAKLFDFKWDYPSQRMYAHLKYSVILGSLALYMSLFHDKDASKMDIKDIQRKAANFGDVKRLDRYIKKLK